MIGERSDIGKTVDSSHEVLEEDGSRLLLHTHLKATMTSVRIGWGGSVETSNVQQYRTTDAEKPATY